MWTVFRKHQYLMNTETASRSLCRHFLAPGPGAPDDPALQRGPWASHHGPDWYAPLHPAAFSVQKDCKGCVCRRERRWMSVCLAGKYWLPRGWGVKWRVILRVCVLLAIRPQRLSRREVRPAEAWASFTAGEVCSSTGAFRRFSHSTFIKLQ